MGLPVRLTPQHPLRKVAAAAVIALASMIFAIGAARLPLASTAMGGLDTTLYDAFYRFRKPQDRTQQPIVIVTVDEASIRKLSKLGNRWPWSRDLWAATVQYMQACGATALVFDVEFQDKGNFDDKFAAALDAATLPVIIATAALPDGKPDAFAPKTQRPPKFGAVNLLDDKVARRYPMSVHGMPTLAAATVQAVGAGRSPPPAHGTLLLRYFGPYERRDGGHTYAYLDAASVCKAAVIPKSAASVGIRPEMFRDKIVLIGGTATGTFDLKSSPLSAIYPGVEIHATAIDDLMSGQSVEEIGVVSTAIATLAAALATAVGAILPRRVSFKILLSALAWAALIGMAIALFVGSDIRWLRLAAPIVALFLATIGAFAWSYLTEDRQRRFVLKALSQYLSPHVAAEISRDPSTLKLGGQRRDMTVLFSDIQGFTDLSETMPSERLSQVLNVYLGEMSAAILAQDGTLDKYIGDAIMSFWNAPVLQANHAELACRAALAMRAAETALAPRLAQLGAAGMLTRIGVNTGPMVVGNMGSPQKFNYSVLGDSVNLGSRLEGANKFYGSRILISETTRQAVGSKFVMRQVDLLRVKGRAKPLAVFELLGEGQASSDIAERIDAYHEAFALYQARKWIESAVRLERLVERRPDDLPANALLTRVRKMSHDEPPDDWDGVYVAKDK